MRPPLACVTLSLALLSGCAAAPAPPAEPPVAATSQPSPKPPQPAASEPPPSKPPPAAAVKVTGAGAAEEDTTVMDQEQCDELAKSLTRMVFDEDMRSVAPSVQGEQRQKIEAGAAEMARKVSADFHASCSRDLAGHSVRREMVRCLIKARDLATFQGCGK
jgi:hypothetical protein